MAALVNSTILLSSACSCFSGVVILLHVLPCLLEPARRRLVRMWTTGSAFDCAAAAAAVVVVVVVVVVDNGAAVLVGLICCVCAIQQR